MQDNGRRSGRRQVFQPGVLQRSSDGGGGGSDERSWPAVSTPRPGPLQRPTAPPAPPASAAAAAAAGSWRPDDGHVRLLSILAIGRVLVVVRRRGSVL